MQGAHEYGRYIGDKTCAGCASWLKICHGMEGDTFAPCHDIDSIEVAPCEAYRRHFAPCAAVHHKVVERLKNTTAYLNTT
jgi:hypothetical protein